MAAPACVGAAIAGRTARPPSHVERSGRSRDLTEDCCDAEGVGINRTRPQPKTRRGSASTLPPVGQSAVVDRLFRYGALARFCQHRSMVCSRDHSRVLSTGSHRGLCSMSAPVSGGVELDEVANRRALAGVGSFDTGRTLDDYQELELLKGFGASPCVSSSQRDMVRVRDANLNKDRAGEPCQAPQPQKRAHPRRPYRQCPP
jgi:hypothetical protein